MRKKKQITIGFQLGSTIRKNGMYPVVVRITQNRKLTRINTALEVKKSDWNQKAKNHKHFRTTCLDARKKNLELDKIYRTYEETYLKLDNEKLATKEAVAHEVEELEKSFYHYAKKITQEIHDTGHIRDYKKHYSFVRKLEAFMKSKGMEDVLFTDIKLSLLRDFDNFLRTLPNERHPELLLQQNTIVEHFKIFKRILNKAITIDGLMFYDDNPFLKTNSFTREEKTLKEGLDESEMEKIKKLDLEEGTNIWHARNAFLFSFYCRGIRSGDLLQLRWCNITHNGTRLLYEMSKSHKIITNELVQQAKDILALYENKPHLQTDYIFPFLKNDKPWAKYITLEDRDKMPTEMKEKMYHHIDTGRSIINNNLRKIARACGITKKLSSHIARHSFTQLCVDKGTDSFVVKSMLGHTKLETTEKYMGNFESRKIDTELGKIFEMPKPQTQPTFVEQLKTLPPEQLKTLILQAFSS